jgi:SAM-dependent methyltransferase
MDNVQKTYTDFHKLKQGIHLYPTEWVIRTFLGKYARLNLDKSKYPGSTILDLGFGDCRNMPLLHNCRFSIHGVEISEDILSMARGKLSQLNIPAELRVGSNVNIPYEAGFFNYVLACHSCYYVDKDTSFTENIREIARVLKKDGVFIGSLPAPNNFILKDSVRLNDGHVMITNDIFGLRNGYVFRTFEDENEVRNTFSGMFKNISICRCEDDFWGLQINYFLIACEKK